jgi:cytochrome b561
VQYYQIPESPQFPHPRSDLTVTSRPTISLRYTGVAIALHWTIAALIIFNLSLGFFMEGFSRPIKGIVVPLHVSSGITILALTSVRLVWRLTHKPPPLPADMPRWERSAAHLAHGSLYFLMLAMTIVGWSIVSCHPPNPNGGPMLWGLFHLPVFSVFSNLAAGPQKSAHDSLVILHSIGGWTFICVLALHICGALKHQLFDGHDELARMGIARKRIGHRDHQRGSLNGP